MTGTTSTLGFDVSVPGAIAGVTLRYAFSGTLTGTTIVGNYTTGLRQVAQGNGVGNSGYQTFPVTLTKQQ